VTVTVVDVGGARRSATTVAALAFAYPTNATLQFSAPLPETAQGTISSAVTVLLVDGAGQPFPAGRSGMVVPLVTTSSTASFWSAAGSAPATTITIPEGQSSALFRYADPVDGASVVTAVGVPGVASAASPMTIYPAPFSELALTSNATSPTVGIPVAVNVEKIGPDGSDLGPTSAATLTITPEGSCTASAACTAFRPGIHTVTASDGASFGRMAVSYVPPGQLAGSAMTLTGVEGLSLNRRVATFIDGDGSPSVASFAATVDWGDGSMSPATVRQTTAGFAINGTHTYLEEGLYVVTAALNDVDGDSIQLVTTATISDATLTSTALGLPATGLAQSGVVSRFTDADPFGSVDDYTASISWGDGTVDTGVATVDPGGGFAVSGAHLYPRRGTYRLTVSVRDIGGARRSATVLSTVAG
jgi:hypothetical protein